MCVHAGTQVNVVSTHEVLVDYSASKIDMRHRRPALFTIDVDIVPDTTAIGSSVTPMPSTVDGGKSIEEVSACCVCVSVFLLLQACHEHWVSLSK